jgi:hypothetical protein
MAGNSHEAQRRTQRDATPRNNIFSRDPAIDAFLRSRNELTQRQHAAVELLLQGMSDEQAARQLGVDRTTIFRWRKTVAFQRELDRRRRRLWDQSAGQLQALVGPALAILQKQLASDDPKIALRAAAVLLRFATPSRLAPAADPDPERERRRQREADLLAYVDAPVPGQPGAPEDMVNRADDDDGDDAEDEEMEG